MARKDITYSQLLALRDDIHHLQKTSAVFYFFNQPRVEKFFKVNQLALRALQGQMDAYVKEYVQHDANGKPMTIIDADGVLVYVFENDEKKNSYQQRLTKFLGCKCVTHIDI